MIDMPQAPRRVDPEELALARQMLRVSSIGMFERQALQGDPWKLVAWAALVKAGRWEGESAHRVLGWHGYSV